MKKILAFIMLAVMLFLCGCSSLYMVKMSPNELPREEATETEVDITDLQQYPQDEAQVQDELPETTESTDDTVADDVEAIDDPIADTETENEVSVPTELVVTAVDYTREIVDIMPDISYFAGQYHTIKIPALNLDTENAAVFNEQISSAYDDILNKLKSYNEVSVIANIGYEYAVYGDIVGIMMENRMGYQYSEGSTGYDGYYYDIAKDKQLTFDEYLAAFGTDYSQLTDRMNNEITLVNDWGETVKLEKDMDADFAITNAIIDSEKTYISHSFVGGYSGETSFVTDSILD